MHAACQGLLYDCIHRVGLASGVASSLRPIRANYSKMCGANHRNRANHANISGANHRNRANSQWLS
jgi:hypothetical protein